MDTLTKKRDLKYNAKQQSNYDNSEAFDRYYKSRGDVGLSLVPKYDSDSESVTNCLTMTMTKTLDNFNDKIR